MYSHLQLAILFRFFGAWTYLRDGLRKCTIPNLSFTGEYCENSRWWYRNLPFIHVEVFFSVNVDICYRVWLIIQVQQWSSLAVGFNGSHLHAYEDISVAQTPISTSRQELDGTACLLIRFVSKVLSLYLDKLRSELPDCKGWYVWQREIEMSTGQVICCNWHWTTARWTRML